MQLLARNEWPRASPGVTLAALPLFHIYGMTVCMNNALAAGATVVLLPRFDAKKVLAAVQEYKVTELPGAPTMYALLLSHPDIKKYDLSSIRYCISGAAPLPPEIQKRFMELTDGVLIEGYGLTEASPVTHYNPLDRTMKIVKIGSTGVPWPEPKLR